MVRRYPSARCLSPAAILQFRLQDLCEVAVILPIEAAHRGKATCKLCSTCRHHHTILTPRLPRHSPEQSSFVNTGVPVLVRREAGTDLIARSMRSLRCLDELFRVEAVSTSFCFRVWVFSLRCKKNQDFSAFGGSDLCRRSEVDGDPKRSEFSGLGGCGGNRSRKSSAAKPKHLAPKPLRIPESPGKSFPKPASSCMIPCGLCFGVGRPATAHGILSLRCPLSLSRVKL